MRFQTAEPPVATTRIIVERPDEGLARGQYAWPEWGIIVVTSVGIALAIVYLALRVKKLRSGP